MKLSVNADRLSVCSGLINVYLHCDEPAFGCYVEVWDVVGSRYASFSANDNGELPSLILCSSLFPNGIAFLEFKLLSPDTVICVTELHLEVFNTDNLLNVQTKQALEAADFPWLTTFPIDSQMFPAAQNADQRPWFNRDNCHQELEELRALDKFKVLDPDQLRQFLDDGYCVVENFLSSEETSELLRDLKDAEDQGFSGYSPGSSERLHGLHQCYPAFSKLFQGKKLADVVADLFQYDAIPCQSLGYVYGSQQELHQDTVHLTPFPEGFMCGAWVALEDVQVGSGELEVVPGSHRWPRVLMSNAKCGKVESDWSEFDNTVVEEWRQLRASNTTAAEPYIANAGSLLIWHENLMHGGRARVNAEASRRSVVFHLFAAGSLAYYDSSGMAGNLTNLDHSQE